MTTRTRRLLGAAALACTLLTLTACGEDGADDAAAASSPAGADVVPAEAFAPLRLVGAYETEDFGSFDEMYESADRVVVGRFVEFRAGRTIQGDAKEDVVYHVEGVFRVDTDVRGSGPAEVAVEFLAPVADEKGQRAAVDALQGAVGGGSSVAFLREKRDDSGAWRLVKRSGFLTATERYPVDAPLADLPARPDRNDPLDPRGRYESIAGFVASVR